MVVFYTVRQYLKFSLFFYFKKIIVKGYENIPKNKAILFVANHQNALIDPLVIAITNKRNSYFLTRASAFKNKVAKNLLHLIHMLPVYRVRDGWQSLGKNNAIFESCYSILNDKKALVIFPEGNHSLNRRVRMLSKGFTRIIFGALEKYENLDIYIVPIGLNYDTHLGYPQSVSIYYGKAFLANNYYISSDVPLSTKKLVSKTSDELKLLTTHIEDLEGYPDKITLLEMLNADFLDPIATNKLLQKKEPKPNKKYSRNNLIFNFIYGVTILSIWLPYLIWKIIKPKIEDLVFFSTFRYAIIAILVPLFYLLQSYLVYRFFGINTAFYFMAICLSLPLLLKLIPYKK